jgi:hypothetical protein
LLEAAEEGNRYINNLISLLEFTSVILNPSYGTHNFLRKSNSNIFADSISNLYFIQNRTCKFIRKSLGNFISKSLSIILKNLRKNLIQFKANHTKVNPNSKEESSSAVNQNSKFANQESINRH